MARNENEIAEKSDLVPNNDTRKICIESVRVQSGSNHPLGMTLSENRFKKSIETERKSGLAKRASSEMKSSPHEPYELPSKARETETTKVYSLNIQMNKSAGAYYSLPPNLTDS